MKLTYFLSVILLVFVTTQATSQKYSSEIFHEGYLITSAGDTLKGKIKYDMEANIVSLVKKGKIQTFSSHKVYYFEINDEILNTFRQFYSVPSKVNYGYKIPILFELLYEGPLSLLTREAIVQQTQTTGSSYWGGGSFQRTIVEYTFYFLDTKGEITYFTGKRKDLLVIMGKKQSQVRKFMKDNNLDPDDVRDLIKLTAFYNSI